MSAAFSRPGARPSTSIRPLVGRMMSSIILSEVVFPAPFPPRKPNTVPGSTEKLRSSTAIVRSKRLLTRSSVKTLKSLLPPGWRDL